MDTKHTPAISWSLHQFNDLTPAALYDLLRLRSEVFVVEQQCIFQDMDDKDQSCSHLLGYIDGRLAASSRIVPPGVSYAEPSIGRVVTAAWARGNGAGRKLMEESIKRVEEFYGRVPIRIGAQYYLKRFYSSLGFEQTGDIYDEDGIDHIKMLRS